MVQFSGVNDIDTAELLVGCHCLVRRADVPKDNLLMVAPLWDGWTVRDARAGLVGEVVRIEDRVAQPLLVVASSQDDGSEREVLIPLVEEFLVEVDEESACIVVDVPAGLLDL